MIEKTQKPIENLWVVISWQSYRSIERIVKEEPEIIHLMHTEEQNFDELWSSKPIKRFQTVEEAISYFSKEYYLSLPKVRENLLNRFPQVIKKEYLQTIHNLLSNYIRKMQAEELPPMCPYAEAQASMLNLNLAQSRPKLTWSTKEAVKDSALEVFGRFGSP